MDSLTQATLGAAVGHFCWHKAIGNRALLLGAIGGTIPDLDIILYPLLDDIQRLYWHRGESHSIWFILFGSLLSAYLLQRYKLGARLSFKLAALGALLIYATHILIDYFTVYGTQLLAPFYRHGFAKGNYFIIDPLFTLPLLLGCIIAAFSSSKFGMRANILGLVLACSYTIWSFTAQNIADRTFKAALKRTGSDVLRQRTTAGPFTTFLWRHLAQTEHGFLVGYWSIFDKADDDIQFYYIPRGVDLVKPLVNSDAFGVLEWFSQGWWYASTQNENEIKIVDLRFGAIPSAAGQSHDEWQWPFSWQFDVQSPQSRTLSPIVPEVDTPGVTLGLLADRIMGGENWYSDSNTLSISSVTAQKYNAVN